MLHVHGVVSEWSCGGGVDVFGGEDMCACGAVVDLVLWSLFCRRIQRLCGGLVAFVALSL